MQVQTGFDLQSFRMTAQQGHPDPAPLPHEWIIQSEVYTRSTDAGCAELLYIGLTVKGGRRYRYSIVPDSHKSVETDARKFFLSALT